MRRPELTRKLVLEEAQRVPDGAGGFDQSWVALGTVWADIRARAGRESDQDHATVSRQPLLITVRAAPLGAVSRPRPDQRFREGSRTSRIQSVSEADPRGRFLLCQATEESVA